MFSIEELYDQLEPFSGHTQVDDILDKLYKIKQDNGETNNDNIVKTVGQLRTALKKVSEASKDSESDQQLQDIVYDLLLALAQLSPLNTECFSSLEPIAEDKKIILSTGHVFDAQVLIDWLEKNGKYINPYDNLEFSQKDLDRIDTFLSIQEFITEKGNINAFVRDNDHDTMLIDFIKYRDTSDVIQLIDAGASINQPGNDGLTPLMLAAKLGKHRVLAYLLNKGAKVDAINNEGMTAWQFAHLYQQRHCSMLLVQHDASNELCKAFYQHQRALTFIDAVSSGHVERVKEMIDRYPELCKMKDDNEQPITKLAIAGNHAACLSELKVHGAPLHFELLGYALSQKADACFALLFEGTLMAQAKQAGFEVDNIPLVYLAAQNNCHASLRALIAEKADFTVCYQNQPPLFAAVDNNHVESAHFLLQAGANVNELAMDNQISPLYHAIVHHSNDCIPLLMQFGAKMDLSYHANVPPISLAVMSDNPTALALLISRGEALDRTYEGQYPGHLAVHYDNLDCLKLLIKAGIDPNQKNDEGETILDIAAQQDDSACLAVLQTPDMSKNLPEIQSYMQLHTNSYRFFKQITQQTKTLPIPHQHHDSSLAKK